MTATAMQATTREEMAMIQTMRDPHPEEACVKEGESHGIGGNAGHDGAGEGYDPDHARPTPRGGLCEGG